MSDESARGRPEQPHQPDVQRKAGDRLFSFLAERERLLERFLLAEVLGPPRSRRGQRR